jgi:hypothetical protein
MGVAGNDLDIRNEDLGSLNLPQVDEHGLEDDHILWPDLQVPLEIEHNCIQTNRPDVSAEERIEVHMAPEKSQMSLHDRIQSSQGEHTLPILPSGPHVTHGRKLLRVDLAGDRASTVPQARVTKKSLSIPDHLVLAV